MSGVNYIALTDLLRKREAEFVAVWKCEQEISRLLGGIDYPFSAPPDLPSRMPVRKKPVTAKKSAEEPPSSPIRPLCGKENAYRVSYVFDGRREVTYQTDSSLIASLILVKNDEFRVLKVEAVVFAGMENWKATEVVWSDDVKNGVGK